MEHGRDPQSLEPPNNGDAQPHSAVQSHEDPGDIVKADACAAQTVLIPQMSEAGRAYSALAQEFVERLRGFQRKL
jgi:hypothetical protein